MSKFKIAEYPQSKYRFALYDNADKLTWQQIKQKTGCVALVNLWYFHLTRYTHEAAVMLSGKWECKPQWDYPGICVDKDGKLTTGGTGDAVYGYAASAEACYVSGKRFDRKTWDKNGVTYTGIKADGTVVALLCSKDTPISALEAEEAMLAAGCVDVLRWDGSWSSQGSLGPGVDVQPSQKRICRGWLLVYPREEKEDKPVDNGREALVTAALGELGAKGGSKYVSWYNQATGSKLSLGAAWCAIFVSWCARQAGIALDKLPNFAGCTSGRTVFKRMGVWRERDAFAPRRGDLVLFDWDGDPTLSEHVGIVTKADSRHVYTVEGNSGGTVREKRYSRRSVNILGYAAWDGTGAMTAIHSAQTALNDRYGAGLAVDGSWGKASKTAYIKAIQTEINRIYKKSLTVDGSFGPASKAACPSLRRGSKNDLVWLMQLGLTVKGYTLDVDGSFGGGTEQKVIAFQKATKQVANGVAGKNTFAALVK